MKGVILGIILVISSQLTDVRTLFFKDNSEKTNLEIITKTTGQSDPVLKAYNGLATMRKAEHTYNPYKKLSYFNKGKDKLETAIKTKPKNAEIRFIRLSAQLNLPDFLNYNKQIDSDFEMVYRALKNEELSESNAFNNNVIGFLFNNDLINESEARNLKALY